MKERKMLKVKESEARTGTNFDKQRDLKEWGKLEKR